MLYTYSESQSDLESETNFQQPSNNINNKNKFVRNNSIKPNNLSAARRRASECSSYYGTADNISFYSAQLAAQNRNSVSGGATAFNGKPNSLRRTRSNKSAVSTTSGDVSNSSCSNTCSDGETTSSSSGQPNLPYPGFVEYSFK